MNNKYFNNGALKKHLGASDSEKLRRSRWMSFYIQTSRRPLLVGFFSGFIPQTFKVRPVLWQNKDVDINI